MLLRVRRAPDSGPSIPALSLMFIAALLRGFSHGHAAGPSPRPSLHSCLLLAALSVHRSWHAGCPMPAMTLASSKRRPFLALAHGLFLPSSARTQPNSVASPRCYGHGKVLASLQRKRKYYLHGVPSELGIAGTWVRITTPSRDMTRASSGRSHAVEDRTPVVERFPTQSIHETGSRSTPSNNY